MSRSGSHTSFLILRITFTALMAAGIGLFLYRADQLSLLSSGREDAHLYGGTDWVTWEDREDGVYAAEVHPLISGNPELRTGYIREGDRLLAIDYQEVFRAEAVRQLVYRSPPGKVFIYRIQRLDPGAFRPQTLTPFVRTGFQPRFTFVQEGLLWQSFAWVLALGAFLAFVGMLVVVPLLRAKLLDQSALILTLLLAFFVFAWQLTRHIWLLIQTDFSLPAADRALTAGIIVLLGLYGSLYFYSRLRAGERMWGWIAFGATGTLIWVCLRHLFGPEFWIWSDLVVQGVVWFFLAQTLFSLLHSMLEKWKGRSRLDRTFHILALLATGGLFLIYLEPLLGVDILPGPGEYTLMAAQLTLFIPMVNLAASELKFGKVSVVLTQTILYLLYGVGALLLYFLIHQVLDLAGLEFRYRNFLELGLLLLLAFAFRFVFKRNEDRIRRYFVLSQQRKLDQLNAFIRQIPQHTSSAQLARDLEMALSMYFEAPEVVLLLHGEEIPEALRGFSPEELGQIREVLGEDANAWSRNRQLASTDLPDEIEFRLEKLGISLVFLIEVRENLYGWLFLSRKKRGVYNLSDLELIRRILLQVRLTLDVLDLIEREKLLLEKNYEANLTALRSQINPHFLFNTLNTISSLIHDAPDEAEEATEKLAYIFRWTLKHSSERMVALGDEMTLISTYLEIEQMRFGARLNVIYEIDPATREVKLPAFVLQTIVENCIKHGIAKILENGRVYIGTRMEEDHMQVTIEDNGPGIDLSRIHSSTGLNNILTRLREIYQIENLLYFENTGNGTRVTLKIPIKTDE